MYNLDIYFQMTLKSFPRGGRKPQKNIPSNNVSLINQVSAYYYSFCVYFHFIIACLINFA